MLQAKPGRSGKKEKKKFKKPGDQLTGDCVHVLFPMKLECGQMALACGRVDLNWIGQNGLKMGSNTLSIIAQDLA